MTIQEALLSGKPFKRQVYKSWRNPKTVDVVDWFCADDILADDWEIEEKKVEITYDQLVKAVSKIYNDYPTTHGLMNDLAKELGIL